MAMFLSSAKEPRDCHPSSEKLELTRAVLLISKKTFLTWLKICFKLGLRLGGFHVDLGLRAA